MDIWTALEYAAWALSFVLIGWMLVDARFVSTTYGEDFLLSSREGEE
ncbi:hypothetical protein [Methyloversatilis thermotolerans]|nr:hypothetical protein [Methyloversatilis thermotolerans]